MYKSRIIQYSYQFLRKSFLSLLFRALDVGGKFLLTIYIVKFFSEDTLGNYSLLSISIALGVQIIGLDFYNYANREIVGKNLTEKLQLVINQLVFHLICYVFILPLFLCYFLLEVLPWNYAFLFYIILILEHLSQEFYRLFTIFIKPNLANFLLFLRSGFWAYIVILLWKFKISSQQHIDLLFYSWIFGSSLSLLGSIIYLVKDFKFIPFPKKVDWNWIIKCLKGALPFLVATLFYKIIEYADRYMINFFLSKKELGIYTYFYNFANLLNIIIFSTVIMHYYPRLMQKAKEEDTLAFLSLKVEFYKKMKQSCLIYSLLVFLFIFIINIYLQKTFVIEYILVYIILLIANIFLNLSYISHYLLYIQKKDKLIILITCFAAILNMFLNVILIYYVGILGAAITLLITFILLYFLKRHYA